MKKWISIVFIMLLLLSTVAGCGDNNTAEANNGIFSNTSTSDGTTNTLSLIHIQMCIRDRWYNDKGLSGN